MNRAEGEEIMKRVTQLGAFHGQNYNIGYAQGFLEGLNSPEALQRPEVLMLVTKLKTVKACLDYNHHFMCSSEIDEVLSKFKEAAKL